MWAVNGSITEFNRIPIGWNGTNSSTITDQIIPFHWYSDRMRVTEGPLSGRRREAAHNDVEILAAAREVFVTDPSAPISAVAARAKVGISALYRRYASKDDLLRELARDGLMRYVTELERALTALDNAPGDDLDPWTIYTDCLTRIL